MNKLLDKLIVLTLCMVSYVQYKVDLYMVVPVLIAMAASALQSYLEKDVPRLVLFGVYSLACCLEMTFVFFLPLVVYDVFSVRPRYVWTFAAIPAAVALPRLPVGTAVSILLYLVLAWMISHGTATLENLKREYLSLRDNTKQFAMQLENKNKELMEKQDYEINLATLNERNRIARDIHDTIGHVLSNSILQTGALIATCKDEAQRAQLNTLKDTLVKGMDSVRESIHDLHNESIDLYMEAKALADGFHFCEISMDYDLEGNPDNKIKYMFLAVIKECLSNIIKHSNATNVQIILREHPAMYQLVIRDNGSKKPSQGDGIGLKNIAQRVENLKGIFNINRENGFTVFITVPKEK